MREPVRASPSGPVRTHYRQRSPHALGPGDTRRPCCRWRGTTWTATGTGDPSSSSFSPAHLRGFDGLCELYVGDPAVAHDAFAQSAQGLTRPRERVQRAIVSTDQALACIRLGDPHAAAELLHDCIDGASSTGGRVATIRLRRARHELRPWRTEGFVADLDDHLIDALGA